MGAVSAVVGCVSCGESGNGWFIGSPSKVKARGFCLSLVV